MSIKMLVFDVDGTLYDLNHHTVFNSTITAIKKAKEMGYLFVIASGRCHYALGTALNNLKPDYILGISGSVIANHHHEVLTSYDIPTSAICELVAFSKQHDAGLVLKCLDHMYLYQHEEKIDWLEGQLNSDIGSEPFKTCYSQDIHLTNSVQGGCIHVDPNLLHEHFKNHPYLDFIQYGKDGFDFVLKGLNKGVGIKALMNHLKLESDEICAIGDNLNDLAMFDVCGYNIAMGNAKEVVKQRANFITTSSEHDGILNAINHLIDLEKRNR